MKYTFRFLALIAAASIVFFSCEKETASDAETEVPGTTDPSAQEETNPGENTQFDPDAYLLSFGAGFENDAKSKVGIDIGTSTAGLTLEEGDEALVYNGKASAVYVYDGAQFKSENPVTLEAGCQVFYPAAEFSVSGANVIFTMPAAVTGDNDSARADSLGKKLPLAGKITITGDGKYNVTFKAVGSILKVNVTGALEISEVKLQNAGPARMPLGPGATFTIGWNNDHPTMTANESGTNSEMSVSRTVTLSDTPETFYYIVPAGVAYKDVTVLAQFSSESIGGRNYFLISRGDWIAERNKVYTMSFYAGLFSGGEGTETAPYRIANARDFKHISEYCTNGYGVGGPGTISATDFLAAHYEQTADINFKNADLSAYMIGGADTPFKGTYDGTYNSNSSRILSNFTISGTPSSDKEGVAPFKAVDNAVLKHISISGATISGGKFTAGLVGYAKGSDLKIQNCSISSSEISGNDNFGAAGLIGGLYGGTVTGCSGTNLNIKSTGHSCGGIVSYINGSVTVSECSLKEGTTTVDGAQRFGGIVGWSNNDNVSISNCVNNSDISSNESYLGGIVGRLSAGTLNACGNTGDISGISVVGGLVGDVGDNGTYTPNAYGVITNKCYNTGSVTGTGNNVGGIAGVVTAGRIEQSRNNGDISSTGSNVGGVVAQLKVGDVNACYSGHDNTIQGVACVGGIVGLMYPISYNSGNRWLGGTKVLNCQSSSYIISTGTDNNGAAGCIVGWARQVNKHWGIVIANCTNWGSQGRVKSTNTGNENLNLGGIVGRLEGSNWAIVDNCFSYGTLNSIQINGNNLAAGTSANTAPFVNIGPVYGYMTGNYATIRDCFYRSGWNNNNYKGNDARATKTENIVLIQLSNDNVGKGTATQDFSLYSAAKATYPAGTLTLLQALNRSAHNINDESTFKNYQTNVNSSNIAYQGWAQPTAGGWLVPAALEALGSDFYKN